MSNIDDYQRRIVLDFGKFQTTLDQAKSYLTVLREKVCQAFESGDIEVAEMLDCELEHGYDILEAALSHIEEDGPQLAYAHVGERCALNLELGRIGDMHDAENGLEALLAATYDEEVVNPVGFTMDKEGLSSNLRESIDHFRGNHQHLSDDELLDIAKDAFANSGRQKALSRPPKNPAFSRSLLDAEAILNSGASQVSTTPYHSGEPDLDDEADFGQRLG